MKLLTKKKITYVLNIVLFLILVVPYSYTYSHHNETEDLHWTPNFVFEQIDLLSFYLLITIPVIGFQIAKTNTLRKKLLIISLIVSILYFIGTVPSLFLPIQDFSPSIGNILVLMLFPLIMVIFKIGQSQKQ